MSLSMGREFRARGLDEAGVRRIEKARADAERALGIPIGNKELLLLLVNDTAPKWRRA